MLGKKREHVVEEADAVLISARPVPSRLTVSSMRVSDVSRRMEAVLGMDNRVEKGGISSSIIPCPKPSYSAK